MGIIIVFTPRELWELNETMHLESLEQYLAHHSHSKHITTVLFNIMIFIERKETLRYIL